MYVCVRVLSYVWLSCNPMDCSTPSSSVYGISQAKYWSGLPFPPPGDLPDPGIELMSLASPALAGRFFTTAPSAEPKWKIIQSISEWGSEHPDLISKTDIPAYWAPWTLGLELSGITNKNIWHSVKFEFQIMNIFFSISISKTFYYILSIT